MLMGFYILQEILKRLTFKSSANLTVYVVWFLWWAIEIH